MVDRSRRQESAFRTGLPCPCCGRSLVPLSLGHAVTFQCGSGHELSLRDWEQQRSNLGATAEDAVRKGYLETAQIFHRQMDVLQDRIDAMRGTLSKVSDLPKSRSA